MHSFLSISHKMSILLDEFLCLNKWVIRNNAIWNISKRMKFMKLCLYKSGFFCLFVCVCVLCVYVCAHVCAHMYEHMCIWMETPEDDVRNLFRLLFYLVLWGRISQSDLEYSLPVQLVLLASLLQLSVYLLRLGLQTPPAVYMGPPACPASTLTKRPSHLTAHKSLSYFLFFDL